MFRKKGAGDWKLSVEHAEKVPSLPIIGHALRNDLQTGPRRGLSLEIISKSSSQLSLNK
jgi:hypothetical protein